MSMPQKQSSTPMSPKRAFPGMGMLPFFYQPPHFVHSSGRSQQDHINNIIHPLPLEIEHDDNDDDPQQLTSEGSSNEQGAEYMEVKQAARTLSSKRERKRKHHDSQEIDGVKQDQIDDNTHQSRQREEQMFNHNPYLSMYGYMPPSRMPMMPVPMGMNQMNMGMMPPYPFPPPYYYPGMPHMMEKKKRKSKKSKKTEEVIEIGDEGEADQNEKERDFSLQMMPGVPIPNMKKNSPVFSPMQMQIPMPMPMPMQVKMEPPVFNMGNGAVSFSRVTNEPIPMSRLKGRKKTKRSGSSLYRGVTWHKRDKSYVARVWMQGHSEHLGVFREELRAAVAVDERLIQLQIADENTLNFKTQLERDMALAIIANYQRKRGNKNPGASSSRLYDFTAAEMELLELGVPKDKNGFPNSVELVLANILRSNGSALALSSSLQSSGLTSGGSIDSSDPVRPSKKVKIVNTPIADMSRIPNEVPLPEESSSTTDVARGADSSSDDQTKVMTQETIPSLRLPSAPIAVTAAIKELAATTVNESEGNTSSGYVADKESK